MATLTPNQEAQARREEAAKRQAAVQQRSVVYTDTDGCEVTVTPSGHAFYNVGDWW